jgi:hypothetical protein
VALSQPPIIHSTMWLLHLASHATKRHLVMMAPSFEVLSERQQTNSLWKPQLHTRSGARAIGSVSVSVRLSVCLFVCPFLSMWVRPTPDHVSPTPREHAVSVCPRHVAAGGTADVPLWAVGPPKQSDACRRAAHAAAGGVGTAVGHRPRKGTCLSVCLSICLSVCLSVRPSIRLSVCPSTRPRWLVDCSQLLMLWDGVRAEGPGRYGEGLAAALGETAWLPDLRGPVVFRSVCPPCSGSVHVFCSPWSGCRTSVAPSFSSSIHVLCWGRALAPTRQDSQKIRQIARGE